MPRKKIEPTKPHVVLSGDNRFYVIHGIAAEPVPFPRVSTVLDEKAKGIGYYKWLAGKNWDQSQAIMEAAGKRGTNVHKAIEVLINGGTVNFQNFTIEEYDCLLAFQQFWLDYTPKLLRTEFTVYSLVHGYAGTADALLEIQVDGQKKIVLVDWKTSGAIYSSYFYQLSAYVRALAEMEAGRDTPVIAAEGLIVRVGAQTKTGYQLKWLSEDDGTIGRYFNGFTGILQSWKAENPNAKPRNRERPASITLPLVRRSVRQQVQKNKTAPLQEDGMPREPLPPPALNTDQEREAQKV